jgi:hypothetical protein
MKTIDYNKVIWEGWTVGDFVQELQPHFDSIVSNARRWGSEPFQAEGSSLKEWCMSEQPYYKKHIPGVYNHFKNQLNQK